MMNIALVGCDTSHSVHFTRLLNDASDPLHVPGGRVIAAVPGGFGSIKESRKKALNHSEEIKARYGIELFENISDLPGHCDAIIIGTTDGAQHLAQVREAAQFAVPIFVDKPLALNRCEAQEIFKIGRERGIPIMSSSALRFDGAFREARERCGGERILGADLFGPMVFVEGCPGVFWYGIHSAEMLFAAMGSGIVDVRIVHQREQDAIVGVWDDGRIGTIRGTRSPHFAFGGTLHTAAGPVPFHIPEDGVPFYAKLLREVLDFVKTGVSPIQETETLEIMGFLQDVEVARPKPGRDGL